MAMYVCSMHEREGMVMLSKPVDMFKFAYINVQ